MTVSTATPVKSHTGNGVTTVFVYDFRILKNTDLKVTVAGVTKTLTTDYTMSGVGDSGGGNVTFVSAPANGAKIVLEGNASYDRTTDYQRGGSFDEETVDNDFDRVVILIKQLKAILDRIPQLAAGTTLTQPSLPDPVSQRFLRWKSDLSGLENIDIATLGLLAVSDFIKTVLDDADAAAARTTLGLLALAIKNTVATGDIDADAVIYAKMQNISATQRLLGRNTAGAGDPEEVTLSQLLDWIGSAAQGDVLYRGAAGWERLAAGTVGYFLKTQGAGANPAWAAASMNAKVGSFTRDMTLASGTQIVSGLTFTPKAFIFFAACSNSIAFSSGADDGAGAAGATVQRGAGNYITAASSIQLETVAGTDFQYATVTAKTASNFTLTWTKVGSPTGTGTVYYVALG